MSRSSILLTPVDIGPLRLPNRLVMAPLTRNRAGHGNVPGPLNATYYAQRASAGLIISEATQVTPMGQGYPLTPGIHSPEQVAGWRLVTDAVHAKGGRIFLQLWHVGRISHPSLLPAGATPVSASAIAPGVGTAATLEGPKPFVTPRALETREIAEVIEQFRRGASNAQEAGFDGVEVHGANGYLLDQFLRDGTNRRADGYGGPIANRARLHLEVTEAVAEVWGADRVGVRLSPSNTFNDMHDSDPLATFGYLVGKLAGLGLAYLHLMEPMESDYRHGTHPVPVADLRPFYPGKLMINGGFDREKAEAAIEKGTADLVSFGKLYIANPDLAERFQLDSPLNQPDPSTFYGGDAKGYVDYPALTTA